MKKLIVDDEEEYTFAQEIISPKSPLPDIIFTQEDPPQAEQPKDVLNDAMISDKPIETSPVKKTVSIINDNITKEAIEKGNSAPVVESEKKQKKKKSNNYLMMA